MTSRRRCSNQRNACRVPLSSYDVRVNKPSAIGRRSSAARDCFGRAEDDAVAGGVAMTRPLCPFPQVPHYKGSGPPTDAASFDCVMDGNTNNRAEAPESLQHLRPSHRHPSPGRF